MIAPEYSESLQLLPFFPDVFLHIQGQNHIAPFKTGWCACFYYID